MIKVETIVTGLIEENCYLLINDETNECVIVDPGDECKKIIYEINNLKLNPKYVILTHGHFDHVGAVVEVCNNYNIPFYINKTEVDFMAKDNSVFGNLPSTSNYLNDGDSLDFGDYKIQVIETPGHTKGGLCFLINDILFTGDTLFRENVGRSDFIGGNMQELITSVATKLLTLDDNVKVYPGHGISSSIGHEKRMNPYFN